MYISKINALNNTVFKQRYENKSQSADNQQPPRYDVYDKFGATKSGATAYNSKSGDYSVTTRGFLPIIKERKFYYPSKETEVLMKRNNGKVEKVTKTIGKTITQIYDKPAILKADRDFSVIDDDGLDYESGEIYRLTETDLGSKYLLRHDKKLGRKIRITENAGGRDALIYNTKTRKRVSSGKLVYDTRYDEENNEKITENLLTGKVVQRTQYRNPKGDVWYDVKYDDTTGIAEYAYNYSRATGTGTVKYFNGDGRLRKMEIKNPIDKSKEIYTYDTETGKIISHREEFYGFGIFKKPVTCEIIYNPDNDDILQTVEHKKGYDIVTKYSPSSDETENAPVSNKYINTKDKRIFRFEELQPDGYTPVNIIQFNESGEANCMAFDEQGVMVSSDYFDKNNNLITAIDFFENSGKLASVTKYKPNSKAYVQYIYSHLSKYPLNIVKVDEEGKISRLTLNLDSKNNPRNLSSTYFTKGYYDFEWQTKDNKGKKPALKSEEEIISLIADLNNKSNLALQTRQSNFRRLS